MTCSTQSQPRGNPRRSRSLLIVVIVVLICVTVMATAGVAPAEILMLVPAAVGLGRAAWMQLRATGA